MEAFVRGDVVVVPFPQSASQEFKRRPALVLAAWPFSHGTDYLICLITTQSTGGAVIDIEDGDITGGSLRTKSYLRPTYLYAIQDISILYKVGRLKAKKVSEVVQAIVTALN